MYMAEAQVYLDRIADAIRNLNAENVNDISVNLPDDKLEQGKAGSLKYQPIPNKNSIKNPLFCVYFQWPSYLVPLRELDI